MIDRSAEGRQAELQLSIEIELERVGFLIRKEGVVRAGAPGWLHCTLIYPSDTSAPALQVLTSSCFPGLARQ